MRSRLKESACICAASKAADETEGNASNAFFQEEVSSVLTYKALLP